jgi:ubiquinone/menaquinone biosynthesis C-methylase UbiE
MTMTETDAKAFYNRELDGKAYTHFSEAEAHAGLPWVRGFIERYGLTGKRVLEVGCGRGAFQDLVEDYTGVDYSSKVAGFLRKPFVEASATSLPFEDNRFDGAWTIWTLEHVPDPAKAFEELRRVVKPGGVLFLAPAWHCRHWAGEGYPVRPYSDFGLRGKVIKALIPLRDSTPWRAAAELPHRVARFVERLLRSGPTRYRYGRLKPCYDRFWMTDSDAINAMDQYETLVWFTSRGDECLNYPTRASQFFSRAALEIRVRKP